MESIQDQTAQPATGTTIEQAAVEAGKRARAKASAKGIEPAERKAPAKATGKAKPKVKAAAKAAPAKGPAKKATAPKGEAKAPRADSKKARAIELLRKGVTAATLQKKFGWQAHTVRGFVSILGKTMTITSEVVAGERTYQAK